MKHAQSFEHAAEIVAQDFVQTLLEEGFESFNEMRKCYWWEPSDIRKEMSYSVGSLTDNCSFWDDGSYVELDGKGEMPYKDFKRMVLSRVDEIMKDQNRY